MNYDKNSPFLAPLLHRDRQSGPTSQKDIFHLKLGIRNSGITYNTGDWLALIPVNPEDQVERLENILSLPRNQTVYLPKLKCSMTIHQALMEKFTISRLNAGLVKNLLSLLTEKAQREVQLRLQEGASWDGMILADFFENHRPEKIDPETLFANLKPLLPRLYSIASSPLQDPESIDLLIATTQYYGPNQEVRHGIASHFINHRLAPGERAKIYITPSRMRLPNPENDIIMIGPGTGLAPFLAFLQERAIQSESQKTGRNWLFFGDQHRLSDFLMEDRLLDYQKRGILQHLSLAFSRDQGKKIYVQDRIWDAREEIFHWIQGGAIVYICGDGNHMAPDVKKTFLRIFQEFRHGDEEGAQKYFEMLKRRGQYRTDVY